MTSRGILIFLIVFTASLSHVHSASEKELSNIKLRLYTGERFDADYQDEFVGDAVKLMKIIDPNKPTVLYVHGLNENLREDSVKTVISAYLERQDHNTIAADYSEIAAQNYIISSASAPGVGETLAKALNDMVANSLNSKTLHVVGHSLGGQVSGFIGRNVNFTMERITGLDPAGPGFNVGLDHLSSQDAKFVDIIHTDAGVYGNAKISGSGADFYPNGGVRYQPGCPYLFFPLDSNDFCSHYRSWQYYSESLINEEAFVGLKCESLSQFNTNKCKNNNKILMGIATPRGTKGSFYLKTNSKSPYGRGKKGAIP